MRSLVLKLTLAFLVVGVMGVILVAVLVGRQTERAFDRFVLDRNQANLVATLADYYQENGSWAGVETFFRRRDERRPQSNWRLLPPLTLIDASRRVVYSAELPPGEPLPPSRQTPSVPIEVDGTTVGWLVIDSPNFREPPQPGTPESTFLSRLRQAVFSSAVGAIIIALLLGGVLARTISRPVRELTEATKMVAQGKLGYQVTVRSHDELGELVASFNQMSADLAHSTRLRRQMTADIAHDLRTPLSVILGYTEALSDGKLQATTAMYQVMHKEAQHLNRLIDDLRTLSLADAGELPLILQPVAPRSLLERAALAHTAQAAQQNVALRLEAAADLPPVAVDPERMAQVFDNLVSNALRYTPPQSEIVLTAASHDDGVLFKISDRGAGIDPQDLPYIFNRFYRGDKSRSQNGESGLGLAIARSIVKAHGGTITAESTPGEGTTFSLLIPTHSAPPQRQNPRTKN